MTDVHPATWIRIGQDSAPHAALTAAPSAADDGVPIPGANRHQTAHMAVKFSASGAMTFTLKLFGYKPNSVHMNSEEAVTTVSNSGAWYEIDSTDYSESANGTAVKQFTALSAFTRLYVQMSASTGTPTVYTDLGFSPSE